MVERNKLPRYQSLKSRVEISRLFREGKRYAGKFFTLVYQPDERFRYGVFLSRRHGSAVERNRIKRFFREVIRLEGSKILKTGKVAVLPRPSNKKTRFEEIRDDVSRVFQAALADIRA